MRNPSAAGVLVRVCGHGGERATAAVPCAAVGSVGERGRLARLGRPPVARLEPRQDATQVGEQQVGEVVAEPATDDDAQRREVGALLRERVRRHLPAALAQRVGDVEDGVALTSSLSVNANTGSSSPRVSSAERPDRLDLVREPHRDLARVALHLGVAVEPETQEVVVLRDHLGAGAREVRARTSACCRRGS